MKTNVAEIQARIDQELKEKFRGIKFYHAHNGKNKNMGRKWGSKRQQVAR